MLNVKNDYKSITKIVQPETLFCGKINGYAYGVRP